jgi:hypothetical protein
MRFSLAPEADYAIANSHEDAFVSEKFPHLLSAAPKNNLQRKNHSINPFTGISR